MLVYVKNKSIEKGKTMKKITFVVVLLMVLTLAGCSRFDFGTTGEYIITAKDAMALVDANEAILVDVSAAEDYAATHIENAINIPYSTLAVNEPYDNMLPEADVIETIMSAAGITADDQLVLYDRTSNMHASRVLWTLNMYGNFNVKVISGGLDALIDAGENTTTSVKTLPAAIYVAGDKEKKLIVSLDYLKVVMTEENTVIIDARNSSEVAQGKIPGAINIFFTSNHYVNGEFQSIRNIQLTYLKKGVSEDAKIIIYCHSGMRSADTYVALKNAGFKDVRIYDGSWLEYYDIEAPAAPGGDQEPSTPPSGGCGG
jgi:thiosulfate/3-mercaptopyruvate sulfurtransferase